MHIAFLTPEYPYEKIGNSGGIGTSIKNLAEALVKQQVQVSIFIYGQKKTETFSEGEITFYLIENKNYTIGKGWFYRKYVQNFVNKICIQNKIELIEAPDWTGFTAFIKFKVPLVLRLHGSDTYFCELENRPQKLKNKLLETIAIKQANALVAPSKFTAHKTAELFNLNKKAIKVIPNGVNTTQFNNTSNNKYTPYTLLYFGTLIRKKGVLHLPAILNEVRKKVPQAQLILIGNDSYDVVTNSKSTWELIKKQSTLKNEKQITYLGKIPYSQIQSYIANAHVCIFPSLAETFGMVTAEAMAMGKIVVSSNFGWASELIVDNESGLLADPTNHKVFAAKITEAVLNVSLAQTMGVKARTQVEKNFDIDLIAKKNINFYNSLIK